MVLGLLLAVAAGCSSFQFPGHGQPSQLLEEVKATDLQAGSYCEIEMIVPPTSPAGSSHCYKGKVKEITREEVALEDAVEESNVEYGSGQRRPPTQLKRPLVRVPLLGVAAIWALPRPEKPEPAAGKSSAAAPAAVKLPSSGARPELPPAATYSSRSAR
jgi:hypothetical protein